MRRRVIQIVLLLIVGVVVNIGVAWACALWSPAGRSASIIYTGTVSPAEAFVAPEWFERSPTESETTSGWPGVGVDVLQVYFDDYAVTLSGRGILVLRTGWPFRSLYALQADKRASRVSFVPPGPRAWDGGVTSPEWLRPRPLINSSQQVMFTFADTQPRPLPCWPEWEGLAGGGAFYAAMIGTAWMLPGLIRRAYRRRRGLCLSCGYPASSAVCSECGARRGLVNREAPAPPPESRSLARRWMAPGAACLALGAIANLLVAWRCALWSPAGASCFAEVVAPPAWAEGVTESWPASSRSGPCIWSLLPGFGVRVHVASRFDLDEGSSCLATGELYVAIVLSAGWPFDAVMCTVDSPLGAKREPLAPVWRHAAHVPGWEPVNMANGGGGMMYRHGVPLFDPRPLPLRPVWTGMIAGAVFYGVVFGGAALGVGRFGGAVRRLRAGVRGAGVELV